MVLLRMLRLTPLSLLQTLLTSSTVTENDLGVTETDLFFLVAGALDLFHCVLQLRLVLLHDGVNLVILLATNALHVVLHRCNVTLQTSRKHLQDGVDIVILLAANALHVVLHRRHVALQATRK